MTVADPLRMAGPGHPSASDPDEFDYERSSRHSASAQSVPAGGVPRALRESAEQAGLDPIAELYNEALRYAQEGHLRFARERLQMLLCMAPDDGDARLMLAKVHVAGQRWKEALAALDEAVEHGAEVPRSLRRAVEENLQSKQSALEEHRAAVSARTQGEVLALRNESRKLRSESIQLNARIHTLEREIRRWAWATTAMAIVAIAAVVGSLALSSGDEPSTAQAQPPQGDPPPELVPPTPGPRSAPERAPEPAVTPALADAEPHDTLERAKEILLSTPSLEDTSITLGWRDGILVVDGEVSTYKQRKAIERVLRGVSGVGALDLASIEVQSRLHGTTHVVQSGDTLSHIAYAYYGDSSLTQPIEEANGVTAHSLHVGKELLVPALP